MTVSTQYISNASALQQQSPEPMFVDDTDENSTSSTVGKSSIQSRLEENPDPQLRQQPHQSCDRDGKRIGVRFANQVSYFCGSEQNPNNDDLWYTRADYHFFRKSTLSQAQHVIDMENHNHAPHSYRRVLLRIYTRHCCCTEDPMPVDETIHLQRWMTAAPTRIGLEKWCIGVIARDKLRRRTAALASVKAAHFMNKGDNYIRSTCEHYSQASVLLAQVIAKGVASSLEREDGHPR